MIFDSLNKYKNNIAIINQQEKITYNLLNDLTEKINFGQNKLILILSDNNIETVILYVSAIKSKSSVYLIDNKCDDKFLNRTIKSYKPDIIAFPKKKNINNKGYYSTSTFRGYIIKNKKNKNKKYPNKNLALLLTTSGTTGTQKLVKLSYKNISSNASSISQYLGLTRNDCSITTLPIFYSYGLSVINSHLYSGSKIILSKSSILESNFWKCVKRFRVTNISMVPFFFDILKKINFDRYGIKTLRFVTVAGGKLDLVSEKYFNKFFFKRKIKLIKMYGATEASPRISYLKPKFNNKKIGSIGKVIPGGNLHIEDKKGKKILKPHITGYITYSGPNVFMGYSFSRDDLITDDTPKYLNTGDLGYFDKDGFFFITGRTKRFAKIFGHRINLDEIENTNKALGFQNATISDDKKIIIFLKKKDKNKSTKKVLENININSAYVKFVYISKFPVNSSNKINYEKLKSIY